MSSMLQDIFWAERSHSVSKQSSLRYGNVMHTLPFENVVFRMLLLLLWTSTTLCGEGTEGIKHVQLSIDRRLGQDADKSCETSEASDFGHQADSDRLKEMTVQFSSEVVHGTKCGSILASNSFIAVEEPEDSVLARHPSEILCAIQAQRMQREAPGIYSAFFGVLGLVPGCKYRTTLLLWSQIYGTVLEEAWEWLQINNASDKREFEVTTPSLASGMYSFVLMTFDAFPGLKEDDALLAVKRRTLEVEASVTSAPRTYALSHTGDYSLCSLTTSKIELKQSTAASIRVWLDCSEWGVKYVVVLTIFSTEVLDIARSEHTHHDDHVRDDDDWDAADTAVASMELRMEGEGQDRKKPEVWRGTKEGVQQDGDDFTVEFRIPPLLVSNYTLVFSAREAGKEDTPSSLASRFDKVEVQRWTAITCFDEFCRCEKDASCKAVDGKDGVDWSVMDLVGNSSLLKDWIQTSGKFHRGDFDADARILDVREDDAWLHTPVSVMNLPAEKQRKSHMHRLLAAVGFSNVSFPPATLARDLDLTALYEAGWLAPEAVPLMIALPWIGEGGLMSYVANAVGQLSVIEHHVKAGSALGLLILEDDLMPTAEPAVTRAWIREAVKEVSQIDSADILYLEMCYESCSQMTRHGQLRRIAKSYNPKCSGAIFYTQRGARRVLELCKPVFAGMDNMLPRLIERGMLEAYSMVPPAFVQDSFFGTSVRRNLFQSMLFARQHFPLAPPCSENSLQLEDVRSAAYAYAPSESEDLRYVRRMRQGDDQNDVECGEMTSLFVVLLGQTFCKDSESLLVPGIVELQDLAHDHHIAWAAKAGSDITVFAMPNPSRTLAWCFLVDSDKMIDVTSLRSDQSDVLLLIRGAEGCQLTTSGRVLIADDRSSRGECRRLLLEEALMQSTMPLLRFSWFVWCGGEQVLDGTCLEEARNLPVSPESSDLPVKMDLPQDDIGSVWWEHIGKLVKEAARGASWNNKSQLEKTSKKAAHMMPVILHPKAGASSCSHVIVRVTRGEDSAVSAIQRTFWVDRKEISLQPSQGDVQQVYLRDLTPGYHSLELTVSAPDLHGGPKIILFQHWMLFYVNATVCDEREADAQITESRPDVDSWSEQLQKFLLNSVAVQQPLNAELQVPQGMLRDSVGVLIPILISEQLSAMHQSRIQNHTILSPHSTSRLSQDVIERASMISALNRAVAHEGPGASFVFVDLGAGYGPQGVRAALLGREFGLRVRTICVEAEPTHFELLQACYDVNGLRTGYMKHRLVNAAASGENGRSKFVVGDPLRWWGQAMTVDLARMPFGMSVVDVEVITLKSLLEDEGVIHLMHVDVQGAELRTLRAAAEDETLNKIQAMLVKTHSPETHWGLIDLFCRMQWHSVVLVEPEAATRFAGRFKYKDYTEKVKDGMQVWLNPARVDIDLEMDSTKPVSCEGFSKTWPIMHLTKEKQQEDFVENSHPQDNDSVEKGINFVVGDAEAHTMESGHAADILIPALRSTENSDRVQEVSKCFPSDFLEFPVASSCASDSLTSLTVCSLQKGRVTQMDCVPIDRDQGHWTLEFGVTSEAVAIDDFKGGKILMDMPPNDPETDLIRSHGVLGRKRTAMWVALLEETCASSKSRVVVDAACGVGYHALLALAYGCHVVCMEPDPERVGHLIRSVDKNSFQASIVIVVAAPCEDASTVQHSSCWFRRWEALLNESPTERHALGLQHHPKPKKYLSGAVVEVGTLLRGRAAVFKMDVCRGCKAGLLDSLQPWLSDFGFDKFLGQAVDTIDNVQIEKLAANCNETKEGFAWAEDWGLGKQHVWKDFWINEFTVGQLPLATKDLVLRCYSCSNDRGNCYTPPAETGGRLGWSPVLCNNDRGDCYTPSAETGGRLGWSPVLCSNVTCSCSTDSSCWNRGKCRAENASASVRGMMDRSAMIPVVESMHRYFRGDYHAVSCPPTLKGCQIEFPVHVKNLLSQESRRLHMEAMLAVYGLSEVSFPASGSVLGKDLQLERLLEEGWITTEAVDAMKATSWIGERGLMAYIASARGSLEIISDALQAGHSHFIVMEDDVVPSADPEMFRARVRGAVEELPPSADMLYLEMCFESCTELCALAHAKHIVRAVRPKCTGAILFTARGAARVLKLCKPIFAAIDSMFPILIERGLLEAYTMIQPAFVQDSFFGSSIERDQDVAQHGPTKHADLHFPVAPVCVENEIRWHGQKFSLAYELVKGREEKEQEYLLSTMGMSGLNALKGCRQNRIFLHLHWREVLCQSSCTKHRFTVRGRWLSEGMCESFEAVEEKSAHAASAFETDTGQETMTGESEVLEMLVSGDRTLIPGQAEGRHQELYLATSHVIRPVLVHPLPRAEQRDLCFLVYSPHLVDTRTLHSISTAVVSLVSSAPPPPAVLTGDVLFQRDASTAQQQRVLLESALARFRLPLVMFRWFLWCDGESVIAGQCAQAAAKLLELQPAKDQQRMELFKGVAAISWQGCKDVVLPQD